MATGCSVGVVERWTALSRGRVQQRDRVLVADEERVDVAPDERDERTVLPSTAYGTTSGSRPSAPSFQAVCRHVPGGLLEPAEAHDVHWRLDRTVRLPDDIGTTRFSQLRVGRELFRSGVAAVFPECRRPRRPTGPLEEHLNLSIHPSALARMKGVDPDIVRMSGSAPSRRGT